MEHKGSGILEASEGQPSPLTTLAPVPESAVQFFLTGNLTITLSSEGVRETTADLNKPIHSLQSCFAASPQKRQKKILIP